MKVNVTLRPDQELYDTVILPNQQVKRLAGLITDLLRCYRDDPYVRAAVDGSRTLPLEVHEEVLRDIRERAEELSDLEFYASAAQSTLSNGESRLSALEQEMSELRGMLLAITQGASTPPVAAAPTPPVAAVPPPSPESSPSLSIELPEESAPDTSAFDAFLSEI